MCKAKAVIEEIAKNIKFDELDFFPSLNWIFAGYSGSKNPVQTGKNIQLIKLKISN